ncbi:MAG: type I 3-dehydroquinate dehydratase [Acetobacterium sp.]
MATARILIEKNKFASCMPLISENDDGLFEEAEKAIVSQVDFLEWRRDYFRPGELLSFDEEMKILKKLKNLKNLKGSPGIIYTFRSHKEGGAYETPDHVRLSAIGFAVAMADYVDIELKSDPIFLKGVKEVLKNGCCGLILSHHQFKKTPNGKEIEEIYDVMEEQGADVLKLAVMPSSDEDMRQLIGASLKKNENTFKPIIAIAMGALGGITRVVPDLCGGSLTYVAGIGKTAPGQLTVEEIMMLRKSLGQGKIAGL